MTLHPICSSEGDSLLGTSKFLIKHNTENFLDRDQRVNSLGDSKSHKICKEYGLLFCITLCHRDVFQITLGRRKIVIYSGCCSRHKSKRPCFPCSACASTCGQKFKCSFTLAVALDIRVKDPVFAAARARARADRNSSAHDVTLGICPAE